MKTRTNPRSRRNQHAFTLVELSVVLAIIGLLAGGVMAGQYMVRRSELQSVINDFTKYKNAYYQFRQQYGGLPGDLLDATDYWDTDPTGCPSNNDHTPHTKTCNGGGDGFIGYAAAGATTMQAAEWFRAWQHMADAGLIEGSFSGVAGSLGTLHFVPGQNAPASAISKGTYALNSFGTYASAGSFYAANYGTTLHFGSTGSNVFPTNGIVTPREAYSIDSKIDDGKPAYGSVLTMGSTFNPNCANSDTAASAAYALTQGGRNCVLIYILESY